MKEPMWIELMFEYERLLLGQLLLLVTHAEMISFIHSCKVLSGFGMVAVLFLKRVD